MSIRDFHRGHAMKPLILRKHDVIRNAIRARLLAMLGIKS